MKYRLTLIAIIIGMLGLVSAFVYAQSTPVPTETPVASSVIQQDIFVRGGPGRDYLPVGKLLAGDHVRPLSRNAQGDWVLIVYGKGYGWIRRDLAFWVENIDTLPIMDAANLTPSPVLPTTPTQTPILLPTFTPAGNWVQLNADAQSGFVRAGPGRTYLRLGQLLTGDVVQPVSRNEDGSWIMIRFGDGFGWVARNLVLWVDNIDALPVISVGNLTPSATFTVTNTATPTSTATNTLTATATATITATFTAMPTASFTLTSTPSATSTETPLPTASFTLVPSATETLVPTATSTATLTQTVAPSATTTASATATYTDTVVPTATSSFTATLTETMTPTVAPSATHTLTATLTSTVVPTSTFTATVTSSDTATAVEAVIVPSATETALPSQTSTSTVTPSPVPPTSTATVTSTATPVPPTQTAIPTVTVTLTSIPPTSVPVTNTVNQIPSATTASTKTVSVATQSVSTTSTSTPEPTRSAGIVSVPTSSPSDSGGTSAPNGGLAPEVLIAGIVLLVILTYAVFYWRGITRTERYTSGFVIETCPVCQQGHLIVESRQERLFGIPRARHSVRCTECRSVLREVDEHYWRYAVDPLANPDLYQRFNGKIIDDQTLIDLSHDATRPTGQRGSSAPASPPDFIDDDT